MEKLLILALLFGGSAAFGQVANPSVVAVPSTPSACGTLPLKIVTNTPNLYGTNGSGGCTAIGGGGGSGTISQVQGRYTISISGGTISAQNNATGAIDYTGTDAAVVVNSILTALGTVGGTLYFKNGIYPINSLTAETNSGCAVSYGIGIPPNTFGNFVQWHFEGEQRPGYTSEVFGAPIQNNGVIFYVTPTAVASVGGSVFIAGIWQRPGAGATSCVLSSWTYAANEDYYSKFGVRFPLNNRGNEGGIIGWAAAQNDFNDILVDYNMAASDYGVAPPAAGSIGIADSVNFIAGVTEHFKDTFADGYDIGFDLAENTTMVDSGAVFCNYPAQIGRAGGGNVQYHPVNLIHFIDQENAHGIVLGGAMNNKSNVNMTLDVEAGSTGWYARNTFDMTETNPGNSYGQIIYSGVIQGGLPVSEPLFNAVGAGANIAKIGGQYYPHIATASTPVFTPPTGTSVLSGSTVAIACTNGTVYYCTGSLPCATATTYSGPVTVSSNVTINGLCAGIPYSPTLASATYSIGFGIANQETTPAGNSTPLTTQTMTAFPNALTNNSSIVVFVFSVPGAAVIYTATDTALNTYADCGAGQMQFDGGVVVAQALCTINTHTTASNVVAVHASIPSQFFSGVAYEIAGANSVSPIDGTSVISNATGSSGPNSLVATTVTPGNNNDLVIAFFGGLAGVVTPGTAPNTFIGLAGFAGDIGEYFAQGTAAPIIATATDSVASDPYGALVVVLKQ